MTVTMPFTVDEMVEHFSQTDRPSADDLAIALIRVGRNAGPALLADLHAEGLLSLEAAAAAVGGAWNAAEYPERYIDHEAWRALFELVGYTRNGIPAERPTEPLILYRGSVPARRAGWSWTDQVAVATKYANGLFGRQTGALWRAEVEPWRLLARNDGADNRNEEEFVVDTDGLLIVSVDDGSVATPVASGGAGT